MTPRLTLVPPPTLAGEHKATGTRKLTAAPRDPKLEWLLLCGDSVMGARGTLAGVVSQIERGSVGGSGNLDEAGCYSHTYTDMQLGLGAKTGIGEVEEHRWLIAAWRQLSQEMRGVLLVLYSAPRAEFRSDGGYGARDRWVEGSDARPGSHESRRTGVEALLGEFSGLCFALCDDPAKLLMACREPMPQLHRKDGSTVVNKDGTVAVNRSLEAERRVTRRKWLKLAQTADGEAHRCWSEAKASVAAARALGQRVGWRPTAEERAQNAQVTAGLQSAGHGRVRDGVKVDDASFGEAVRAALEASGRLVAPRGPRRVVMAAGASVEPARQVIDLEELRRALLAEQAAEGGLLGLLNGHADEALL